MRRTQKQVISAIIVEEGGELVEIIENKHLKVYVRFGDRVQFYVTSSTPSDYRSLRNFRAEIRRDIKKGAEAPYPSICGTCHASQRCSPFVLRLCADSNPTRGIT